MAITYSVYSLKSPRQQPASIFYIGKGIGSRDTEHIQQVGQTRKGKLIQDILDSGSTPSVTKILSHISEEKALQIVKLTEPLVEEVIFNFKYRYISIKMGFTVL